MNGVQYPEGEKNNFVPVINYEFVFVVNGPSKLFHPMGVAFTAFSARHFFGSFFGDKKWTIQKSLKEQTSEESSPIAPFDCTYCFSVWKHHKGDT